MSDIRKMAIADIKPGTPIAPPDDVSDAHWHVFDYSHVLPPEYSEDHKLVVAKNKFFNSLSATFLPKNAHPLARNGDDMRGHVTASLEPDEDDKEAPPRLKISVASLKPIYRNKGIGAALYESLMAHARHHHGVADVIGDVHSTMARKLHQRLSTKHGMDYHAEPAFGHGDDYDYRTYEDWAEASDGPFDAKYGSYAYAIKDELPMAKANDGTHLDKLVDLVTSHLSDDIRKPQYQGSDNCLAGHCYVASETLYHMLGGKESGWVPMNIQHEGGPHWYLKHKHSGVILDPTASQFKTPVPYENGRGRGFLTKQPSKRSQIVLDRIVNSSLRKNRPTPKFPKLGLPDDRRETPIVTTPHELKTKQHGQVNAAMRAELYDFKNPAKLPIRGESASGALKPQELWDAWSSNVDGIRDNVRNQYTSMPTPAMGAVGATGANTAPFALGTELRDGNVDPRSAQASQQAPQATKLHEDWHMMMTRIQNKYGVEGRKNVVANMLRTLNSRDPKAAKALAEFSRARNAHIPAHDPWRDEEAIASLLNYLNNPKERLQYARFAGLGTDKDVNQFSAHMKRAHNVLTQMARENAGPMWALKPMDRQAAARGNGPAASFTTVLKSETFTEGAPKQVSSVAVFNDEGYLLLGKRADTDKWNCPGGKAEPGETPEETARREVKEETGLSITELECLGSGWGGRNGDIQIHCFRALSNGKPETEQDPDKECESWEWVDVAGGLPEEIRNNLHNGNLDVTLQLLGLLEGGADVEAEALDKSWKHMFAGAAAAAAISTSAMAGDVPKFNSDGLHEELMPIAKLESNYGKYTNHAPHSKGEFHTAVGSVGLKPITAHDEYMKTPWLQKVFPNLHDPAAFTQALKSNPALYNHIATVHWNHLKKLMGGDPAKTAYAWRWGQGAAAKTAPEIRAADPYVQAYVKLTQAKQNHTFLAQLQNPLNKSETAEAWLAKNAGRAKYWQTPGDVRIPHHGTPERQQWDQSYKQKLIETFGAGNENRLVPVRIPIDANTSGHFVGSLPVGRSANRSPMYQRMAAAGDPMPPLIVRRNGQGWNVVDGNNRLSAMLSAGRTHADAFELLDSDVAAPPRRKSELPKNVKLYDIGADEQGLMEPKVRQTKYGQFFEPVEMTEVHRKLKRMGYEGYHGHAKDPNETYLFSSKTQKLPKLK
jgi:8-oxo-dGTP pyrophosphatase MutT (NUDIX family)/GNAT superfamily N-acetyltransferase